MGKGGGGTYSGIGSHPRPVNKLCAWLSFPIRKANKKYERQEERWESARVRRSAAIGRFIFNHSEKKRKKKKKKQQRQQQKRRRRRRRRRKKSNSRRRRSHRNVLNIRQHSGGIFLNGSAIKEGGGGGGSSRVCLSSRNSFPVQQKGREGGRGRDKKMKRRRRRRRKLQQHKKWREEEEENDNMRETCGTYFHAAGKIRTARGGSCVASASIRTCGVTLWPFWRVAEISLLFSPFVSIIPPTSPGLPRPLRPSVLDHSNRQRHRPAQHESR